MKLNPSFYLELDTQVMFPWNGRTYTYNGAVELLPESHCNGLLGQRVYAHKRWARGGPAFVGWLRGAIMVQSGKLGQSVVYLVEKEDDRKIYQSVKIRSIE